MNNTQDIVTADMVVELVRRRDELQAYVDDCNDRIRQLARELTEQGGDLLSSYGLKVSYSASPRREVLPTLVQLHFPDVYDRIKSEQMASYEPKLSLMHLSRHLTENDMEKVVTLSQPVERVRLIDVAEKE
ncbi:MAG: hypothetical protein EOM68_22005 [Spirochaetia bacterium]|nr:hypothetical protein [Spirochaetia bacterium]